jgi:hypothetical protein
VGEGVVSRIGDWNDDFCMAEMITHLGDSVTYRPVDSATSRTISAVFNEFVGAIDEISRAIFTIHADNDTRGVTNPRRGDRITLDGREWKVVDIRSDEAGTHELRCDVAQEDV